MRQLSIVREDAALAAIGAARAKPARAAAEKELQAEDLKHRTEVNRLETRLDKLSRGTGDRDVTPLKAEIQRGIDAEKDRHVQAIESIKSGAASETRKLAEANQGPNPVFQGLVTAVMTFAFLIVMFWAVLRFAFRTEIDDNQVPLS